MNGQHKITGSHRERTAVVYLRQSSMAQVRQHTESTRSQYALADRAAAMGWARRDIEVIDTDLGVSGKWGVAREGFTGLVTRVCTGEVGAIFGIEITRLARSNAEVARLAEFAAITDTLLIGSDAVYDPADVNDRVLLGFKGTMGEMELHVMAQRLQASKRAAAERGELRTPLPVGYVHDDAGDIVIDPDAEVQAAIRDVFAAFTACGSAYGVVTAFEERRFPLRAYGGAWAGQLRWGRLTHARVLGVLKNPCYAGAYVHGRYTSRRTVEPDGTVRTGLLERPRAEWPVLIKDHHEGYVTWADYLAHEARLAANQTNAGARPPREGSALCQGIIYCGSCGKPMRTNYHDDDHPAYECSSRAGRLTTPSCRSVSAVTVDDAVAAVLLEALTPEQVALALAAADEVTDRHQRVSRAAELAVERARYEADRAERAFSQVEPENRLVARSLEARWEARLTALADAEEALEAAAGSLPPLPGHADLEKLAADLPGLWHAPETSSKDRKRLLRTLIADVAVLPEPDRAKVRIGIRWHTGATNELRLARAVHPGTARRSPSPAVEIVRRLGPVTPTAELAAQLNAAGMVTGNGRPFDVKAVQWIRHAYNIPAPAPHQDGEISVDEAADRLGCSAGVVYYWIKAGQLEARRGAGNRLCIPWNDGTEAACRERVTASGHLNPGAVPWDLVLRAVKRHCREPWVLLYVKRWLEAPLQLPDGTIAERTMGTPQGSAISPLLANLFMHYAFDAWMARTYPAVTFERYCDDAVVHCRSKAQAEFIRDKIAARLAECGLELHPVKTRIVYCKDSGRSGSFEHEQFTFLGYTFRPRLAKSKTGHFFVSFSPAVSRDALVRIRHEIRGWRIHRRSDMTFAEIIAFVNTRVAGWAAYYGRFYKSALYAAFRGLNVYLMRWAMRKYKSLKHSPKKAWAWLESVEQRAPGMFAHWRFGVTVSSH